MKKETIGKFILGILLASFLYLHYVVLDRVFKQPSNLTEVNGIIDNYQIVRIPKRYAGYNYAYALKLKNEITKFAIHNKNERAFNYITNNNIQNKKVKLLYDKNGHNSSSDLTFHVYSLEIENRQILEITESKRTDKIGLFVFLITDIVLFGMIFYAWKLKNNPKLKNKNRSKSLDKKTRQKSKKTPYA